MSASAKDTVRSDTTGKDVSTSVAKSVGQTTGAEEIADHQESGDSDLKGGSTGLSPENQLKADGTGSEHVNGTAGTSSPPDVADKRNGSGDVVKEDSVEESATTESSQAQGEAYASSYETAGHDGLSSSTGDVADKAEEKGDVKGSANADKGKAKAVEAEGSKENSTGSPDAEHPSNSIEDSQSSPPSKTPSPPPQVRYCLPIGGPSKRRPQTAGAVSTSTSSQNTAGPSNTTGDRPSAALAGSTNLPRERMMSETSSSSTIKTDLRRKETAADEDKTPVRRRLSGSDIPKRSLDDIRAEARKSPDARKRSATLVIRGDRSAGKKLRDRVRPRTAPAEPTGAGVAANDGRKGIRGSLKRRAATSTVMIDGQMFTLDDEAQPGQPGSQSLRARSDTNATSTTEGHSSQKGVAGPDGMMILEGAMRNPVAALDEPMIYEKEELDDIPPPGSYAIHPPSQRRLEEAAQLSLFDEDGNLVKFGTLFENQRTLVIFLRHWFCPFCQMFAQSIKDVDPLPLQRAELGMVVIGQGHAHVTKSYKEVMKIPSYVRMFADPTRRIYTALGMTLRTNDPGPACARPEYQTMGVLKASLFAIKKGVVDMPIRMPGDTKLLGGEFILGPGLQCSFTHRMVTTRGHLDLPRILVQAGCDLSLRAPKDVLAERDSAQRRPGSTRSVDRITARRIARRMGRKTLPPTQTDALAMQNKQATAAAVADGNQPGAPNARSILTSSLSSVPRSLGKRFNIDRAAQHEDGMAGVEGKVSAVPRQNDGVYEIVDEANGTDGASDTLTLRARRRIAEGMQTGFSRTMSMTNVAADKARHVAHTYRRPQSAKARSQQRFPAPPPLPHTSSEQAFQEASARQQWANDETESLRSDEAYGGMDPILYGAHTSTVSLGRGVSWRSQADRQQNRQGGQFKPVLARNTFSSPDLHAASAMTAQPRDDDVLNASVSSGWSARRGAHNPQSSANSQTGVRSAHNVPITLPFASASNASLASTSASASQGPASAGGTPILSSSGSFKRNSAHGVPLSVFEKRILNKPRAGIGHGHSYSQDDAASLGLAPSPRMNTREDGFKTGPHSPLTTSFGEDTDYKRLSRSALHVEQATTEQPGVPTIQEPASEQDNATEEERKPSKMSRSSRTGDDFAPDMNDKTPKGRIISLYADEISVPGSTRTSRDDRSRNFVAADEPMPSRDSLDAPPPVPPKSPKMFGQKSLSYQAPLPSRAPVPAPTPAFASILAAESARRDPPQATPQATMTPSNEITLGTTVNGTPFGSGPALFAGLPPLMASAAQSKPPTETRTETRKEPQPAPATGGNPLQAAALTHSRESSFSSAHKANGARGPVQPSSGKMTEAGSFLDDLETVDGFRSHPHASESNGSDTAKSPMTPSTFGGRSQTEEDYDDEETDYTDDWAPLQAQQNVIPARPKSSTGTNGRGDKVIDAVVEDDEEDWSENDTEGEEEVGAGRHGGHHLALLGVLSKGAKKVAAPGSYVVKRVTSRPVTAPSVINGSHSSVSGTTSARKIQISRLARKPQTAGGAPLSTTGRRLSSFAEEEEEQEH